MSKPQPSWQLWMPDDLNPPAAVFESLLAEKKRKPKPVAETEPASEPVQPQEPTPEEIMAMMRDAAREQGFNAGYAEGKQQGFEQGRQEGLVQGQQAGLAQAQQQQAPIHAQMQQLVSEFQNTLDALDSVIPSRLMQLALEAARQVIGQMPVVDNSALIKQIQTLLQQEPMFSGKPILRVHPDDLQRIEEMAGATLNLHGWRLRADPSLHPGGCKVSADEGDLDASVATRWQELCRLAAPGVL
ncbi:flagellar assembly protein H [Mangrovibacter sp. MFB070]|uniref:flagellar assembly protein FliH n=1 Tax=Mangrovibacter sp. MFB070 TaxID=1224318 RepID=UPI0004D92332|nr:flagellar assembly protein FliH [Mangrovibacter sp. MFB070]KEA54629.1 flagellar assembly protein H [Mangrovibacter sp. MFB070]